MLVVISGWSTPHPSLAWMLSPLDGGWNLGILESRPGTDVPIRWEEEVPTWLQHHEHAVQHNPWIIVSKEPLPSEEEAYLRLSRGLSNPLDALVAFLSTQHTNNKIGVGLY